MIQNDEQLRRTHEALAHLESAMALLKRDRHTVHPERFALMAEPIAEDIRRLRADIDEYIGLTAAPCDMAPPEPPQGALTPETALPPSQP